MIDLFLKYASDPAVGPELEAAIADLTGTAGQGNADLVETAELAAVPSPRLVAATASTACFSSSLAKPK